jgi:Ser/Thr protein kinase RdoA (MazF antagonist)
VRLGRVHKAGHLRVIAGHREAVTDAAGRLHQAGGRYIALVQQDARRKVHEACAPVGLHRNHSGHLERLRAQQQRIARDQV